MKDIIVKGMKNKANDIEDKNKTFELFEISFGNREDTFLCVKILHNVIHIGTSVCSSIKNL